MFETAEQRTNRLTATKYLNTAGNSCIRLIDAVDDDNKRTTIKELIECSIAIIKFYKVPGADQTGIVMDLDDKEMDEFENNLLKLIE